MKLFLQKNYPLLIIFIIFLLFLVSNLSFNTFIMGWDNFSFSLDLQRNFFRTLFSTWREYRGLGVPSDSESVDVFRLIIQTVLSFVLPLNLIDQFYYLILYVLGLIGSYLLVQHILLFLPVFKHKNTNSIKYASFFAAIVYGFNLHVVETFYLPVVMYPARYAFFPILLLLFLKILTLKQISYRSYKLIFLFCLVILFSSTSYLTATVFITLGVILLTISTDFLRSIPKFFLTGMLIVLLNSFWLFPFIHYTITKAPIIPVASSFIDVNEALLNKPAEESSWTKLLRYYPLTISPEALPFYSMEDNQRALVHESLNNIENSKFIVLFFVPLFFVALGLLFLLVQSIRSKSLIFVWPPLLFSLMLFLLRKDLPPFGWLYHFIDKNIPLFSIIFRFSGTKFYPVLLLASTILASFGFYWLLLQIDSIPAKKLRLFVKNTGTLVAAFLVVLPFYFFFTGSFFSSIVKVSVPVVYDDVAFVINSDDDYGRVLHLPYDQFSYWRSHTWGYFGSAFFQYLIDNPLIDRTFEPASLENDYYLQAFLEETRLIQTVSDLELQQRLARVENVLTRTGTKYIIFDESVSTNLEQHQLKAWGVFNADDFAYLITKLKEFGYIELQQVFTQPQNTEQYSEFSIYLYKVKHNYQPGRFLSQATLIDPNLQNGFSKQVLTISGDYIQKENTEASESRAYPFIDSNTIQLDTDGSVIFNGIQTKADHYSIGLQNTSKLNHYKLYIQKVDEALHLFVQLVPFPIAYELDTQGAQKIIFEDVAAQDTQNNFALQLGDAVFEITSDMLQSEPVFIGEGVFKDTQDIRLFQAQQSQTADLESFTLTEEPNCFADATAAYQYQFEASSNSVELQTQDGMTCIILPLFASSLQERQQSTAESFIFKVRPFFTLNTDHQEAEYVQNTPAKTQKIVRQTVDNLAEKTVFEFCLLNIDSAECANQNTYILSSHSGNDVWTTMPVQDPTTQLLIVLPSGKNEVSSLKISQLEYESFSEIARAILEEQLSPTKALVVTDKQSETTTVSLPVDMQTIAFSTEKSSLRIATDVCDTEKGYQTTRFDAQGRTLMYAENCPNISYANISSDNDAVYLWLVKYRLFSGKHPRLIVSQNGNELYNQIAARFTEYPNIDGFRVFHQPNRWWWNDASYQSFIDSELAQDTYFTAHAFIQPAQTDEVSQLSFQISQLVENQGLIGIEDMKIIKIPRNWYDISLQAHADATAQTQPEIQTYLSAQMLGYKQVLSSLWEFEIKKISELGQQIKGESNEVLFEFGQAYNPAWQLYSTDSPVKAFFGIGRVRQAEHVKVNGWSNGWIIPRTYIDGLDDSSKHKFYVLYWPERLALAGWFVTLATSVGVPLYIFVKHRKSRSFKQLTKFRHGLRGTHNPRN